MREDTLVGQTITAVRLLTDAEAKAEGWEITAHEPCIVIETSGGWKLYPSRDDEGNGPGALFAIDPADQAVRIFAR